MKIVMQRITSRGAAPAMEHERQLVSPAPHTLDSRLRLVRGADMLQHNHGGRHEHAQARTSPPKRPSSQSGILSRHGDASRFELFLRSADAAFRSTALRFPLRTSNRVSLPSRQNRISNRRRPSRRSINVMSGSQAGSAGSTYSFPRGASC